MGELIVTYEEFLTDSTNEPTIDDLLAMLSIPKHPYVGTMSDGRLDGIREYLSSFSPQTLYYINRSLMEEGVLENNDNANVWVITNQLLAEQGYNIFVNGLKHHTEGYLIREW